jgi:hypothetical protein
MGVTSLNPNPKRTSGAAHISRKPKKKVLENSKSLGWLDLSSIPF